MIGLPHLMILQYIKKQMRFIRANPEYLTYALEGYESTCDVRTIFGAKRIDDAIEWISRTEFNYTPVYNLDAEKLPNICVSYDGGNENDLFLGDSGGVACDILSVDPKVYVSNLSFKGITDERNFTEIMSTSPLVPKYGYPIVPASVNIGNKIWRGLSLQNACGKSYKIKSFHGIPHSSDIALELDSPMGLSDWEGMWYVVSSLGKEKNYKVKSSMDNVTIRAILTIAGDPELAEMVACVFRYVLKSSRLFLEYYGLRCSKYNHTGILLVDNKDNPTWRVDFTISGKLQDMWLEAPINGLDFIQIDMEAAKSLTATGTSVVSLDEIVPIFTPSEKSGGAAIPIIYKPLLIGMSPAKNPLRTNFSTDVTAFEDYTAFNHDIVQYFSPFDTRTSSPDLVTPYFYQRPLDIWNAGKLPCLTWYPSTSNVYPTPADINAQIAAGVYDSYMALCCSKIKDYLAAAQASPLTAYLGTPKIYIRFAHEMNISSHIWSKTPTTFIAMWQYVYSFVRAQGLSSDVCQFIWCPNNNDLAISPDITQPPFEQYYPGDAFVDWTGLDGYNFGGSGPWQSFSDVFTPSLIRMKALAPTKPVCIAEYGCAPKSGGVYVLPKKFQWISDAFNWLSNSSNTDYYNIKMAMYYNVTLSLSDIDSGIFIPQNLVIDTHSLNYTFIDPSTGFPYFTFANLSNAYFINNVMGFKNNKKTISPAAFAGLPS